MSTGDTLFSLFFLIGLGYLAKRILLNDQPLSALNTFVYYFALPALLFSSATRIPVEQLLKPGFIAAFVLAAILTATVTLIGCRLLLADHDKSRMVIHALNSTFANFAYMGIPVVFGLLGEASYAATICIILAGNLFIVGGSQLLIEALCPAETTKPNQPFTWLIRAWRVFDRSLLRSPIFVATVAGVSVSALQWQLPAFIDIPINMLAQASIPVALFCLGASLELKAIGQNRIELVWLLLAKLVIHPLITLLVLQSLGFTDPDWLIPTVLLTALPTGALAHVIALRYNIGEQQTSLIIVLSTLVSAVTLWAWVSVLI